MSSEPTSSVEQSPPLPGRAFPPTWLLIFAGLAAVGVLVLQANPTGQRDIENLLTLLLSTVAIFLPTTWMALRSNLPFFARILPLLAICGAIGGFFSKYKLVGVTGDLNPKFADRWKPLPDQALPSSAELAQDLQQDNSPRLVPSTPFAFPQFLGPTRSNKITRVSIQPNWDQHPPQELWRNDIGAGWSGFVAVNGYAVTMEQRDTEELVTCYEVDTGKLRWVHSVTTEPRHETVMGGIGPRSTPTIDEGRVYALGATGVLRCLDGTNGEALWTKNLLADFDIDQADNDAAIAWGRSASPLIVDRLVVVPVGGPSSKGEFVTLVAYDKASGALVWKGGSEQVSYVSPMVTELDGVRQIVYTSEAMVFGFAPEDGTLLWEFDWPGQSNGAANNSQPVLTADGKLFISKGYGQGCALLSVTKAADGTWAAKADWTNAKTMRTKFTNVVLHDGHVYGLSDGILECISLAEEGKRMWKRGRYKHGQVMLVDDVILVQGEDGEIAVVATNPDKYEELHRIQALSDTTWNNLCLYKDRLLARNATEAVCYQLALERVDDMVEAEQTKPEAATESPDPAATP